MNKKMTIPPFEENLNSYIASNTKEPFFINGNALDILKSMPDKSVNMCITSPPYWGQRQYQNGGIGLEKSFDEYINNLCEIFYELKRVLKDDGSFWLNIGDSYKNKALLGLPWRIAFELIDNQGWVLRNSVIWNKVKGAPDNSKDKLRNIHENIFHFVKKQKDIIMMLMLLEKNQEKQPLKMEVLSLLQELVAFDINDKLNYQRTYQKKKRKMH